jgi:hypothetical protein
VAGIRVEGVDVHAVVDLKSVVVDTMTETHCMSANELLPKAPDLGVAPKVSNVAPGKPLNRVTTSRA